MDALNLLRENSREAEARQILTDHVARRLGFRVSEGCLYEITKLRAKITYKDNLPRFDSLFLEIYEQFRINYDEIPVSKLFDAAEMTGFNKQNMGHIDDIFDLLMVESSVHNDAVSASSPVEVGASVSGVV